MGKSRGRDWRRRQRARHIKKRQDRLPEPLSFTPTEVWQCHTPDGNPLPIYKRRRYRSGDQVGDEMVVDIEHGYGCPHYRPIYNYGYKPKIEDCDDRCYPYPGYTGSDYGDNWPPAPLGFVWKLIRITDPQGRGPYPGMLDKRAKLSDPHNRRWTAADRPIKNWKLLYTRPVKVKRARQLGYDWDPSDWDDLIE